MLVKADKAKENVLHQRGQHDPMRGRHLFAGKNMGSRQTIFGDHRRSAMTLGRR